jgi:hypothetical protein
MLKNLNLESFTSKFVTTAKNDLGFYKNWNFDTMNKWKKVVKNLTLIYHT